MTIQILHGDCREVLQTLPAESVQTVCTSPPYYGLRRYLVPGDPYQALEIGGEQTPAKYVAALVDVFRQVRRVLRNDGVVFLNLGDCYIDKQLQGMPWKVAFALQADGWWLRSDIIWNKPNCMPESIAGSHVYRHRVTIQEYENLSRLQHTEQRNGHERSGDVSSVQAGEIPGSEAPLSAEREGQSYGASAGGTGRREREAPAVLSISAGAGEQGEICQDAEGQRNVSAAKSEPSSKGSSGRGNSNSRGLDQHPGTSQVPMLLLQEAQDAPDDGSRYSTEQGWSSLAREHSPSVPKLQLQEERQIDPSLLVDCPGCPKCSPYNGYIPYLGAGRPTRSHEYIFLLTKAQNYYYDQDAIREPHARLWDAETNGGSMATTRHHDAHLGGSKRHERAYPEPNPAGRNKRTVWTIPTAPYPGAHFATFPEKLVELMVLAGSSPQACECCGAPWRRVVERNEPQNHPTRGDMYGRQFKVDSNNYESSGTLGKLLSRETTGWAPTCPCPNVGSARSIVLDPFAGSGTTLRVAMKHGRDAIGIELNQAYITEQAEQRTNGVQTSLVGLV